MTHMKLTQLVRVYSVKDDQCLDWLQKSSVAFDTLVVLRMDRISSLICAF